MVTKNRRILQVSPEFHHWILALRKKIMMKNGEDTSVNKITRQMLRMKELQELEDRLLSPEESELRIKFDARIR